MPDIVDKATRSRMMAGIDPKNTAPELRVRRYLHANGMRYVLNDRRLPDIVLPRYRTVILVHGCFWHWHRGCRYFVMLGTRTDFWRSKLEANVQRDTKNIASLIESGWRVAVVWEYALRGECARSLESVRRFIVGGKPHDLPGDFRTV
jgi:DNA mismatch endonuclease (patch repair protein)